MLLARIHEALPLSCPICHGQMRLIVFINDADTVKKILDHIGESTQPPRIAPARGPPLWEAAAAAEQADVLQFARARHRVADAPRLKPG